MKVNLEDFSSIRRSIPCPHVKMTGPFIDNRRNFNGCDTVKSFVKYFFHFFSCSSLLMRSRSLTSLKEHRMTTCKFFPDTVYSSETITIYGNFCFSHHRNNSNNPRYRSSSAACSRWPAVNNTAFNSVRSSIRFYNSEVSQIFQLKHNIACIDSLYSADSFVYSF